MDKRIQPLVFADDKRTAFSAGVMNELIAAINMMLNASGKNGIMVYDSDSNRVIALDENYLKKFITDSVNVITANSGSGGGDTYNYNCECRYI